MGQTKSFTYRNCEVVLRYDFGSTAIVSVTNEHGVSLLEHRLGPFEHAGKAVDVACDVIDRHHQERQHIIEARARCFVRWRASAKNFKTDVTDAIERRRSLVSPEIN